MGEFANIILASGRAGIELALFILLPFMIVMLTFMRILETKGVLGWIVKGISPALKPFGLPGLGVFALLQVLFVSVVAPVATLAIMNKSSISRKHIAATLAMVFTAAQANVTFPMSAVGLNSFNTIVISALAAVMASAVTYYVFARNLIEDDIEDKAPTEKLITEDDKSLLDIINSAGKEAFNIAIGALPMLVLALVLVNLLRSSGSIDWLENIIAPLFSWLNLSSGMLLPIITKLIAGGTAMMGVMTDSLNQQLVTTIEMNKMAGFLISPFDLPEIAIMI